MPPTASSQVRTLQTNLKDTQNSVYQPKKLVYQRFTAMTPNAATLGAIKADHLHATLEEMINTLHTSKTIQWHDDAQMATAVANVEKDWDDVLGQFQTKATSDPSHRTLLWACKVRYDLASELVELCEE